jgi:hypothetical protein
VLRQKPAPVGEALIDGAFDVAPVDRERAAVAFCVDGRE